MPTKIETAVASTPLPTHHLQEELAASAQGVGLRSLHKKYGSFVAVENITLDIPAGHYCCLLGPSGCGKTTTLRIIAGHEEVSSGEVLIGDRQVNHLPPAQRDTAMMFQSYALFPHKTVWENVDFGLKMRHLPPRQRRERVGEMLELIGLSHLGDRKPNQLSGGQQQRVALARALATLPKVLLLDEPLSALDETLRVRMRGELRKIQKQFGMTFIQVTHSVDEAFALADQIVVMNNGRIEQVAAPGEVFRKPASQFVAQFMGDHNIFQGTVVSHTRDLRSDTQGELIELATADLGSFWCRGDAVTKGTTAACCVRSDLLQISALSSNPTPVPLTNCLTARITAVELTGYLTRVSLMTEATSHSSTPLSDQEILYKVRTDEWSSTGLQEGQTVVVSWNTDDCVFLPH